MRKPKRMKVGIIIVLVVAVALGISCLYGINSRNNEDVPELVSYVDTTNSDTVVIENESVPLASSKSTTKTTTNTETTTKTVKLKKAATKTYKVKKPTVTKTTTKTTRKSTETTVVKTVKVTSVVESYTKKSKKKVVTTKVKTTVSTTTTPTSKKTTTPTTTAETTTTAAVLQTLSIKDIALVKKADEKLVNAYETLGFNVTIDSSVSYSGYFNARLRNITLKKNDDTIYHELGHFLAFLAGNVDKKTDFVTIYNEEKSKFTGINKAYSTQNSSEYFAESYKNYVENPSELKKSRPKTYASITKALDVITDEHLKRVQTVYGSIWKE